MKKIVKLSGLDCANCAAKIEREISKIDGLSAVSVNFMTEKLTFEVDEMSLTIVDSIKNAVKKTDNNIVIKGL